MKTLHQVLSLHCVRAQALSEAKEWKLSLIITLFCFWFYSCTFTPPREKAKDIEVETIGLSSLRIETIDIDKHRQVRKAEADMPKTTDDFVLPQKTTSRVSGLPHRVLISNNIRSISADKNSVWVATDRGVSQLDRKTKSKVPEVNHKTKSKVREANRSSNTWTHYTKDDGLGSDNVNAVVSDGNLVWFGTDDGVTRYNVKLQSWRTFKEKDGLKGSRVSCIALDGNYVWVGTYRGLYRYDKNIDSWAARTPKDGLSHNFVSAIAIGSEYLWIGTRNGLNRYDRITDSWNTYSKKDGL
nr:hypothetical protein [bacterium]